jgi:hypothetical protein
VKEIKKKNNGDPVMKQKISVGANGKFRKELVLRENDVFMICLETVTLGKKNQESRWPRSQRKSITKFK